MSSCICDDSFIKRYCSGVLLLPTGTLLKIFCTISAVRLSLETNQISFPIIFARKNNAIVVFVFILMLSVLLRRFSLERARCTGRRALFPLTRQPRSSAAFTSSPPTQKRLLLQESQKIRLLLTNSLVLN